MSRIGNKIIVIPEGIKVEITKENFVSVTGPKGKLERQFSNVIDFHQDGNEIKITRQNELKPTKQIHGTTRSLLDGMIVGVKDGYKKELKISGIGYRTRKEDERLIIAVGYSHPVIFEKREGIEIEVPNNTTIIVSGIDKQKVGQMAAEIRDVRKPEPYKGKGIAYTGEHIRRKVGKKAGKK